VLSLTEQPSVQYGVARRWRLSGLDGATVRFYPPAGASTESVRAYLNAHYPYKTGQIDVEPGDSTHGHCIEFVDLTGTLTLAW